MLPFLKGEGGKQAFHVVAPSLPNYGFSGRMTKKQFGLGQYAEVANKAMLTLGYDQYGRSNVTKRALKSFANKSQSRKGDWRSLINRVIGVRYPQHCKASHLNMSMASEPNWDAENPKPAYTERVIPGMAARKVWRQNDMGYIGIQSTKPATLTFSLADSPTGLLAWISEKLVTWTDSYPWTSTEMLTWVSIYWFSTAGPAATIYTYYEANHDAKFNPASVTGYVDVPLAFAEFPKEFANVPKSWRAKLGPVVEDVSFEKGGHFAARECPEELAECLVRVLGKGGGAEGVVKSL